MRGYGCIWVHNMVVCICVVLCEIVIVVMMLWSYIVGCTVCIWWHDLRLIYMCDMSMLWISDGVIYADICGFYVWYKTGFLHIVLNTTCNNCWWWVIRLLILYDAVCVYVDNYVDNLLFCVDNYLLHLQQYDEPF